LAPGRNSATLASSPSTSATPTSRPWRYTHVDREELFDAASRLEELAKFDCGVCRGAVDVDDGDDDGRD
jgi:hypothetical protein